MKRILTAEEQFFSEEEYQDFVKQTKSQIKGKHFMPIRKETKPTTQEKELATEAQAPSTKSRKLREPNQNGAQPPKARSLKDAGIDGQRHQFVKSSQLFNNDDDEVSMAFVVHSAKLWPNTLRPGTNQVVFTISLVGEDEKHLLSLSEDDSRMAYVGYFQTNTIPLGPLELVKLPSSKPGFSDYLSIQDSDVPF